MDKINQPLSEEEIMELDEFLGSEQVPEAGLFVDELHGLFTALACAPAPLPPSEWLPQVWGGEEEPQFSGQEQAQRMIGLVMRMYNSVVQELAEGECAPLYAENELAEGEYELAPAGWCWGFLSGMELQEDAWEPHMEGLDELLAPVFALSGALDEEYPDELANAEVVEHLAGQIPPNVLRIYSYCRGIAAQGTERTVRRDDAKVGRNDPCPCGSGKKYKKCCGAGSEPH